jgi:hypothetical protein
MIDEPHAFEDDIVIEEMRENGEMIYSAYADGQLIDRYSPRRAGNTMVARQLAGAALSNLTLNKDLEDIAVWFGEVHSNLDEHFVIHRYRYQRWHKIVSHIVVFAAPERRRQIKLIVAEAFQCFGWIIDPDGGSDVEWFEAREMSEASAHTRLSAVGRVEEAIKINRDQNCL